MIKNRYKKHLIKLKLEDHPKYILDKLNNLSNNQFGFDGFGLKSERKESFQKIVKAYSEFFYNKLWK